MFGCERRAELEDGFACDRRGSALVASVTSVALLSVAFVAVLGHLFGFLKQIQQSTFWDLRSLEQNLKNKQFTDLSCCGGFVGNVLVLDSPRYYDHNVLGY